MVMQVFLGLHLTTFLELGAGYTSGTTFEGFWDWLKNELLYPLERDIEPSVLKKTQGILNLRF